jgi:hypothetical protein
MDEPAQSVRMAPGSARVTLIPKSATLLGEHPGEAFDSELSGLVGTQPGGRQPPADRGDLDEVPRILCAEDRQRGLGHVHSAQKHGIELGSEVVEVDLFDGCHVGVPGVVDDHVETPEGRDCLPDGPPGAGRIGDVER